MRPIGSSDIHRHADPDRVYCPYMADSAGFSSVVCSVNVARGVPFETGDGGIIDILGMTSGAGAAGRKLRIAVYMTPSNRNLAPATLLGESGEIDAAAGGWVQASGLEISLPPGRVAWLWTVHSVASTTWSAVPSTSVTPVLGFIRSVSVVNMVVRAAVNPFVYGPWPATFPGGITYQDVSAGVVVAIYMGMKP